MSLLEIARPARGGDDLDVSPTIDAVRALDGGGQVVVSHTYIADCETPVSAFLKLRDGGPTFLLESAEDGQRVGRHSMIGIRPQGVIEGRDGDLTLHRPGRPDTALDGTDPFGAVEDVVGSFGVRPTPGLAFAGGAVGFFGYDVVRSVERLPDVPPDDRGLPDVWLMLTGPVVMFDHLRRSLTIATVCDLSGDRDQAYAEAVATVREIKGILLGPLPATTPRPEPVLGPVSSNMTQEAFEDVVERVREYIFAGDAFQVVASQRFGAPMTLDPFAVYRGLRATNPSPYMFFIDTGHMQLVGSSPELHVKVMDGQITLHPIAGTRWRGADEAEDARLEAELLADPKERAEHVMLVDLGRNDVGRVAAPGTVAVTDLMTVRRYSHVMHIESTVSGTLADGMRASDALRATFPAGTLSGAPKVRAMEIIDEMETTKRGPYGGAVGYLGWDGDTDTCITIRTIVCVDGMAYVQAGAGLVADSVPASEHAECVNKARGMFRAIEVAAAQVDW